MIFAGNHLYGIQWTYEFRAIGLRRLIIFPLKMGMESCALEPPGKRLAKNAVCFICCSHFSSIFSPHICTQLKMYNAQNTSKLSKYPDYRDEKVIGLNKQWQKDDIRNNKNEDSELSTMDGRRSNGYILRKVSKAFQSFAINILHINAWALAALWAILLALYSLLRLVDSRRLKITNVNAYASSSIQMSWRIIKHSVQCEKLATINRWIHLRIQY